VNAQQFVITARKGHQFKREHAAPSMVSGALERLIGAGFEVENIERKDRQAVNVRFDVDGRRVQYADADDASEHHIRIMEAGGWEPTLHDDPRDDTWQSLDDEDDDREDDELESDLLRRLDEDA